MNTKTETTEIETTTEVVIDRATERVMTVGAFAGLETAIRTMRSAIGGDTTAQARADFGEDSVTDKDWLITEMNTGDQMRIAGVVNVGASYDASQPNAIPTTVYQLITGAVLGNLRPSVRRMVLDAAKAGMDGASNEEVSEAMLEALNITPEALAKGVDLLNDLRTITVRTRSAPVKFYPSDDEARVGLMPAGRD